MRDAFVAWAETYPKAPKWRDGTFAGSAAAAHVRHAVPESVRQALGEVAPLYEVSGSAGQSEWTHTPWVAILDPAETSTVEEGLYVVYLMSRGCERIYLTLNQGCTTLFKAGGKIAAREELIRRATTIRSRISEFATRLSDVPLELNAKGWRPELYEAGSVLCAEYRTSEFPTDGELVADLVEALALYRRSLNGGGWAPDDVIIDSAEQEIGESTLEQAKIYRLHRRVERNSAHAAKVKRIHGSTCQACGLDPTALYGPIAADMVDAHHLIPLAKLLEGQHVTFNPKTDFAVLCPNCHRAIHRLPDPSDLLALKAAITAQRPS